MQFFKSTPIQTHERQGIDVSGQFSHQDVSVRIYYSSFFSECR